ncbi:MAG: PAS domain S-box protein [Vannielia sp.]|uniref:ATP-binding protein n=1 Tax=Vannielia sp. TaxID=2813045 RepID=UPI003B8E8959
MSEQLETEPSDTMSVEARHDFALRQLFMLSLDPDISFDGKVSELLRIGCLALELPLGIVSKINGDAYRIEYVSGEDWAPEAGTAFNLGETYCTHTLAANGVRHFHHAGESEIAEHPCYVSFGLESYIGVPLRVGLDRVGTLNFSGPDRREPFSAKEEELVRLFGRWLGQEWLNWKKSTDLAEKTMVLDAIVDSVPEGIMSVDEERRITMVNRATERIFGFAKEEMIGKTTEIFFTDKLAFEENGDAIYRKVREAGDRRLEMDLQRRDGNVFPAELFFTPLKHENAPRLGILGVVKDITEQKAIEIAREELISTVSHELRTPITAASAAVKLLDLEKDKFNAVSQTSLEIAGRNLDRLMTLVGDLLDFERLSAGGHVQDAKAVNLQALLENAAREISPFADQHGVAVKVAGSPAAKASVVGEERRLLQVLNNLLSNAIKASDRGANVELGLTTPHAGFWVRDTGPGIPISLQPRLFERFSRAPESYQKGQSGTGLGMGITKTIVEQHAGTIEFDTGAGRGTTFTVQFPEATH